MLHLQNLLGFFFFLLSIDSLSNPCCTTHNCTLFLCLFVSLSLSFFLSFPFLWNVVPGTNGEIEALADLRFPRGRGTEGSSREIGHGNGGRLGIAMRWLQRAIRPRGRLFGGAALLSHTTCQVKRNRKRKFPSLLWFCPFLLTSHRTPCDLQVRVRHFEEARQEEETSVPRLSQVR